MMANGITFNVSYSSYYMRMVRKIVAIELGYTPLSYIKLRTIVTLGSQSARVDGKP
jgi:hypothetical protein